MARRRTTGPRLVLVHWKPEEAREPVLALRRTGHSVRVIRPDGMASLRTLGDDRPDAVVIDLGRLPSQGGAVAIALRRRRATRDVLLVFVGGEAGKTARVRALLPDATYTTWRGLPAALRRALRSPARRKGAAKPVVPDTMAGYSGTPLPRKLGIKPGTAVALFGAPKGFETTALARLPEGVSVRHHARSPFRVGLLFARSKAELGRRFPAVATGMGDPCALWIVWPKKTSGIATDLDGNAVRAFGLAASLVDYKIAAIDATWSGLCFARRKTGS